MLIATTTGPVEIQLLTAEDARIGRSVVCIAGTTDTAGIHRGYDAFVASPTGVVERLYGHGSWRLDVSDPIDVGSSWQLPVLIAHALNAADRLARERTPAETVVLATGRVRSVDLTVEGVDGLEAKLKHAVPRLAQEARLGRRVVVMVPAESTAAIGDGERERLVEIGATFVAVPDAPTALGSIGLALPRTGRPSAVRSTDALEFTVEGSPRGRRWQLMAAVAFVTLAAAASLVATRYVAQGKPHREVNVPPTGGEASAIAGASRLPPPLTLFRDCDDCPEMVAIPAGRYTMGSSLQEVGRFSLEWEQRPVAIERPFAIGRREVTIEEFTAFVGATGHVMELSCRIGDASRPSFPAVKVGSYLSPGFAVTPAHPVVCVSWSDAKGYADWLSKRTGHVYRLPTEAEWEYAARAGTVTRYYFGNVDTDACHHANFADDSLDVDYKQAHCSDGVGFGTAAVGSYAANPWGLHDVHGNAAEWVNECLVHSAATAHSRGAGSADVSDVDCNFHVVRGGHWANGLPRLRSAARTYAQSTIRSYLIGFRVARD